MLAPMPASKVDPKAIREPEASGVPGCAGKEPPKVPKLWSASGVARSSRKTSRDWRHQEFGKLVAICGSRRIKVANERLDPFGG
jgi:hypothetical protein